MWTAAFWRDAAERMIKTFVQGLLVAGVMTEIFSSASQYDWGSAASQLGTVAILAVGMAVVSLLTSIAGSYTGTSGTPQFGAGEESYDYVDIEG